MKVNMNSTKININNKVLQEVCEKFNDAEAFVKERIEELCNERKLSAQEVTYLVYNDYNNF